MLAFAEVGRDYLHDQSMRTLLLGLGVHFRYWYLLCALPEAKEAGTTLPKQVPTLCTRSSGEPVP